MAVVYVDEVMSATNLSRSEIILYATRLVRLKLATGSVDALRMMAEDPTTLEKLAQAEYDLYMNQYLGESEDEHSG